MVRCFGVVAMLLVHLLLVGAQDDTSFCITGVVADGDAVVCCAASCGACGGTGCSSRVGGASLCCTSHLRESGTLCQAPTDSGCVRHDAVVNTTPTTKTTTTTTNTNTTSFCTAGVVGDIDDSVCCAASCSVCGGTGCGSRTGGAAVCCTHQIRASGIVCQHANDTVCVKEQSLVRREETLVNNNNNNNNSSSAPINESDNSDDCNGMGQIVEEVGLPPSFVDLWKNVGYRGDGVLPSIVDVSIACGITAAEMESVYGVLGNDGIDDTDGIQSAIDAIPVLCPSRGYDTLAVIELPSGEIHTSREIHVDVSFLILRGQGNDPNTPQSSTMITFEPDVTTRYDNITDFDLGDMKGAGTANGGWIWPGRGVFRVQTRAVHASYRNDYAAAPDNRKDFWEGSVNFHWKSGIRLTQDARFGDTQLHLETTSALAVGTHVSLLVANSHGMYDRQGVLQEDRIPGQMRQQMFTIVAIIGENNDTITIDTPLEHDAFKDSSADGSSPICDAGSAAFTKIVPLQVVEGVGFEHFYLNQVVTGIDQATAKYNYNNLAKEQATHGIVFKWAVNSYVRNVRTFMTGSHPIVTEVARHLQFEGNWLEGAWNKGKGGNGYFRNSKLWDSLIQNNTSIGLRHLTLQWSASGNVVRRNKLDSDLNLHGGWERHNLFEQNVVQIPYEHQECHPNCTASNETWWPIWAGAGMHAGRWSGATGPRNIFFNNVLQKQLTSGGAFEDYAPYGQAKTTIFQFFWNTDNNGEGSRWKHLSLPSGDDLETWSNQETVNYSPDHGVNDLCFYNGESLLDATVEVCSSRASTLTEESAVASRQFAPFTKLVLFLALVLR